MSRDARSFSQRFQPQPSVCCGLFFFFNDTATTEIYTLSLHDALPICNGSVMPRPPPPLSLLPPAGGRARRAARRSEEHTSELQSQSKIVCRLLLGKKKNTILTMYNAVISAYLAAAVLSIIDYVVSVCT